MNQNDSEFDALDAQLEAELNGQQADSVAPEAAPVDQFTDLQVPPELEEVKRSMQADYTKKTQEIAQIKQKADLLDTLLKDESLRQRVFGTQQQQQQKPSSEDELSQYLRYTPQEEAVFAAIKDDRAAIETIADRRSLAQAYRIIKPLADQIVPELTSLRKELAELKQSQASSGMSQRFPGIAGKEAEVLAFMDKGLTIEQAVGAVLGPNGARQNNGGGTPRNNPPRSTLANRQGGPTVTQGGPASDPRLTTRAAVDAALESAEKKLARILASAKM